MWLLCLVVCPKDLILIIMDIVGISKRTRILTILDSSGQSLEEVLISNVKPTVIKTQYR